MVINTDAQRGVLAMRLGCAVVAAGLVVVLMSDVLRSGAKTAIREWTDWTASNIAAYPELYLDFCEAQLDGARQRLAASKIEIRQALGRVESVMAVANDKAHKGRQALSEWKSAYRQASSGSWPVTVRGRVFDEESLKRQILATNKDVRREEGLVGACDRARVRLDTQMKRVLDALAKATEQRSEIEANRQVLRIDRLTDGVNQNLIGLRSAVEGTLGVASMTVSEVQSLDEVAAQGAGQETRIEFDAIMASDR